MTFDLFLASAPTCDTGAQITAPLSSKIDWLEVRFPGVQPHAVISEYLGLAPSDFELANYGLHGYPQLQTYGDVKVLHNPADLDRGSKVLLSAMALDQIAVDALELVRNSLRDGGIISRLDLAIDERAGAVNMPTISTAILQCQAVTHFKTARPVQDFCLSTGKPASGKTWYFGSAQSLRSIRIYDKQAERIGKGEPDPGPWIRVEVQTRKTSAVSLALALARVGLENAGPILRGILDFRERSEESNITRGRALPWWDHICSQSAAIKTGLSKIPRSIEAKFYWLSRQCSRAIGQVATVLGVDHIQDLISAGIQKTTPSEWGKLAPKQPLDLFKAARLILKAAPPGPVEIAEARMLLRTTSAIPF